MRSMFIIFICLYLAVVITPRRTLNSNNAQVKVLHVHSALLGNGQKDARSSIMLTFETVQELPADYIPMAMLSTDKALTQATIRVGTTRSLDNRVRNVHDVLLDSLKPNKQYFYSMGNDKYGWQHTTSFTNNEVYSFWTGPEVGSQDVRVVVLGDHGALLEDESLDSLALSTSASLSSYIRNLKGKINAFWHVGDISYFDVMKGFEFDMTWNTWFDLARPATKTAPYMVLPGNHEWGTSNPPDVQPFMQNFEAFNTKFRMPSHNGTKQGHNMYYSFDIGPIHFISLSSETDYKNAPFPNKFGDQLNWLQQDLASFNRKNTPWLVVGMHRPIYSCQDQFSDKNGTPINDALILQHVFEDIFARNHVDVVMVGHVHAYERSVAVYNVTNIDTSLNSPKYPIYIVNGGAGNLERFEIAEKIRVHRWSASRYIETASWGVFETGFDKVTNKKLLKWTAFRSIDNAIIDTITINKP